jgi:hypothetical protein
LARLKIRYERQVVVEQKCVRGGRGGGGQEIGGEPEVAENFGRVLLGDGGVGFGGVGEAVRGVEAVGEAVKDDEGD